MAPITRILVPVDFSPSSEHAARYAAVLASRLGASVELLHVVVDPLTAAVYSDAYIPDYAQIEASLVAGAEQQIAQCRELLPGSPVIDTTVQVGAVAPGIVEHAAATGADLIVMATHGRTGLTHVVLGSVAERVVRTAACPVLTIRAHAAAGAAEAPAAAGVAVA